MIAAPDERIIVNARLLTLQGPEGPRRGEDLGRLHVIERGGVRFVHGRIAEVGPHIDPPADADDPAADPLVLDARGRVVMPAFVDCHTHACWAGERYDEFEMKLKGAAYLDILDAGGGIMSTVRSVRAATQDTLEQNLDTRLRRMAALGTGTIEVKSGYGLSTDAELKMLRAIAAVADRSPLTVTPTFLGAHAIDPDNPRFIEETVEETLPAVVDAFPGITCDAYCETGAWSLDDTVRLFERAKDLGCPLRVHADQFNALGMTTVAVDLGARSVDHLEATNRAELNSLAASTTIGVALPACGFQLDDRYAPARAFVDAGGALAIATNYNPGSAPTPSAPFVIALACRKLGLTPAEAISAMTINAAHVLGLAGEVGSLSVGARADVQMLDATDERDLGFEFGGPGPAALWIGGQRWG